MLFAKGLRILHSFLYSNEYWFIEKALWKIVLKQLTKNVHKKSSGIHAQCGTRYNEVVYLV